MAIMVISAVRASSIRVGTREMAHDEFEAVFHGGEIGARLVDLAQGDPACGRCGRGWLIDP
jgi:hypothetical protein